MSYKIVFLPSAEADLNAAKNFYSRVTAELGLYCAESLLSDITRLANFAGAHAIVFGFHRMLSRNFPFSIYYQISKDTVVIVAILDNRKNPKGLEHKLKGFYS